MTGTPIHVPDWRDPAFYVRLSGIDRAGLMWEFLRRDPAYVAWYAQASATTRGDTESAADQWGLHLGEDPSRAAPEARLIWRADFDPGTLRVIACPSPSDSGDDFDPGRFEPWLAVARDEHGGEHVVLSDGFQRIRIDVECGSIAEGRPVLLHYRLMGVATAQTKVLTLRRFLALCQTGRFAASISAPDRRVQRWLDVLRVHDALRSGATQREIAAVLFGEERVLLDWRKTDSLRSRVRRLVNDARKMAGGGYRFMMTQRSDSDTR